MFCLTRSLTQLTVHFTPNFTLRYLKNNSCYLTATIALWVTMACLPMHTHAEIYKTVDENGNTTYTDAPTGDKAEAVKLPPINAQPPIVATQKKAKSNIGAPPAPKSYQVQIATPQDQSYITPGQRDVTVSAHLNPPLFNQHSVQILVNGTPWAKPSHSTSVTLKEIYRGAHQIQARVLNQHGKVIGQSPSITIYVQRASVSN